MKKPPFISILSDPPSQDPRSASDRPPRPRATPVQGHPAKRQTLTSAINVSPSPLPPLSPSPRLLTGAVAAFNEIFAMGKAGGQGGADVDWVRVAPYGEWPNEVGLQVFDRPAAEAMVAAFNTAASQAATLWRGLPIFEGHPDEPAWLKKNPAAKRMALGRVKELQARDDGLYGRVAFNDQGNPLVRGEAPAYEAQSPRWGMAKISHQGRSAFRPMELYSLGLTNQPNIPGTQLGLNESSQLSTLSSQLISPDMKKHIIALLAALGRPVAQADTVSDDQLAAAVNEAVPVATAAMTATNELASVKAKLTTAEQTLATATNEKAALGSQLSVLNSQLAAERTARIESILTTAVNSGRVTPAERAGWKTKLVAATAANEITALETELGKLKPAANTQAKVAGLGARKPEELARTNRIAAINEAVEARKKANPNLSHSEAYLAVQRAQPDLFVNAAG